MLDTKKNQFTRVLQRRGIPRPLEEASCLLKQDVSDDLQNILRFCGRAAADPCASLSVFKILTAGQDETCAEVNKAPNGAIEKRDKWLKEGAHKLFAYTIRRRFSPHVEPLATVVLHIYILFCNGFRFKVSTTLCFVMVFSPETQRNLFVL